jgi:lysine 6-dehydrogenase
MKALILGGSGIQGAAVAQDMVKKDSVTEVVIAARRKEALEATASRLKNEKLKTRCVDVSDKDGLVKLIKKGGFDVVVSSVPWRVAIPPLEASIEAGVNLLDFGLYQNLAFDENISKFDENAKNRGVTVVPSCGVAPGLTNMLAGHGASKLDKVDKIHIFVGGIPEKPLPPLGYKTVWSLEGVWTEYSGKCRIIRDGKMDEVDAASEIEFIDFPKIGRLQAFYTDGIGTLLHSYKEPLLKGVKEVYEKTLRWPGHIEKIYTLRECLLLDIEPIKVKGVEISPRRFLTTLLNPVLKLGEEERDMTVLRVDVIGSKEGSDAEYTFYMADYRDTKTGVLSMARTTGYTGSIVAQMMYEGKIKEKGIVMPEELGADQEVFKEILREYAKRNITIEEEHKFRRALS